MSRRHVVLVLLACGFASTPAPAQFGPLVKPSSGKEALSFEIAVTVVDPFDLANQRDGATQTKMPEQPVTAAPGRTIRVQVKGTPVPSYWTYPLYFPNGHLQDEKSKFEVGELKGIFPVGGPQQSEPTRVKEIENGKEHFVLKHDRPFTWTQDVRISPDTPIGRKELPIKLSTQVCFKGSCFPSFDSDLRAVFEVAGEPVNVGIANLAPSAPVRKDDTPPTPAVTPGPTGGGAKKVITEPFIGHISVSSETYAKRLDELTDQLEVRDGAKIGGESSTDLWAFILAGMFWGGISLITPCVFPMIPITVSFFLKQSEKEHHRPVIMASVYSLTIVVVLTLAAAFMLQLFRWLSINPILNYGLGALFVFFALSLFGMYEIELPSSLARFTSSREGQGGLVGTMFMALTFTIISFACVAPFLGGFGGTAAAARPLWHNLLGGFAFAATFAAPFFVLALFPALLKALPKSGSWLNSVKVVMGFLELAAAFKFFRGAELLQFDGDVTVFSYDLVLGIWIAMAVLCGLYLIGVFRLPHDTPEESIGVPRLLFSAAFLGLALYLTPALFKVNSEGVPQRPGGAVYAWVDAFLLPEARGGRERKDVIADLYYAVEQSREHLKKTGQPKRIFVDFTGVICSNCRYNENYVFPRDEVKKAFEQYLTVEVYTDTVPVEQYSSAIKAEIAKDTARPKADALTNQKFENKIFNDISVPFYAILEPQANGRILIVDSYGGKIGSVADFTQFVTGARAADRAKLAAAK